MVFYKDDFHSTKRARESAPDVLEPPAKRVRCDIQALGCRRSARLHELQELKKPSLPQARRSRQPLSTQRFVKPQENHIATPAQLGRSSKREAESPPNARRPDCNHEHYIEEWIESCRSSRRRSGASEAEQLGPLTNMPHKPCAVLPSPKDSFDASTSVSRKSERTTVSVRDSDYRQSLQHRNIYIERENPPAELIRRAKRIVCRSRASPEIDDTAIQELKDKSRHLQDDAEEEIIQQLAPGIIPAMRRLPDRNLARNADQPWSNAVPIPLKPSVLTNPLPLPKPKPDLAFGYSQAAFTENQLGVIELLVNDQFGQSYACPDQKLQFPFLDIEFKSQAKNGTHYVATNQVAGAGAIALSGCIDLVQRSYGMDEFDYEQPYFFSMTMDHQLACVNVHWIKPPPRGGHHSFHVEGLSQHLLKDDNGIRAVIRAIKNILEYGADQRLRTLCAALDAYRETVVCNREAADPRRIRQGKIPNTQSLGPKEVGITSRHQPMPQTVPAPGRSENPIVRNRHDISPPQKVGQDIFGNLHAPEPRSNAYHISSASGNQPSRHGPVLETKRRTRPTQKLIDNHSAPRGVKQKRRRDL